MDTIAACTQIEERGYCVLEGLVNAKEAEQFGIRARYLIDHEIGSVNEKNGYANLQGALLQMPELAPLSTHSVLQEIAKHFLGEPNYLINSICMKWVKPGAADGPLHCDWPHVPEPYPPWPMLLQSMWMLSDFTATNGGTRFVPGSQRWGRRPDVETDPDREVPAEGRAGSLLIWNGFAWHRSGANTTADRHRVGANIAYIPSYVHRPQRRMWPNVPRALYETFPDSLRQLLERSVEPGDSAAT